MSAAMQIEWLSLIESTGPFLAVSVLDHAMPQGLDTVIPLQRKRIRSAYEEWCDAVDETDPRLEDFHREWIRLVIEELLEYDASVLKSGEEIPDSLSYQHPQTSDSIRPDFIVTSGEKPKLFIATYPPEIKLESPLDGEPWAASPLERMTLMCRAKKVPIGLVTNGERWTLVGALPDGTTSYGSWFARIWLQEQITLQAFQTLLGIRRCFGPEVETLEALFTESLKHQDEVTDTLGGQVRRAIEVLVQALDRADLDRDRKLLKDVSPKDLYDAGLTVMMRLVFILCAEERKLLLLGEPTYNQHYAVSTLRAQLLADAEHHGLEVLERRHDAWSRVLAVFRGVFAGIEHENLRLPALGGSIFDPDKYPFLEGRAASTTWEETPAAPLPIDNRTVLMLLNALQVLEQSSGAQHLSYEALDVEQIGHVYEGLLERTAQRVPEATVGFVGTAKSINPNVSLRELEEAAGLGEVALAELIVEKTGRSISAVRNATKKKVPKQLQDRLLSACGGNSSLSTRIKPFASHLRTDNWGDPLVYRENAFIVTLGAGRRESGTHYTPKSLTEPIVQHTLEPLVYIGPAKGKPESEWKLKKPTEILDLKVCDLAMGSGAFLVQTCRWLGGRLVEAWNASEKAGKFISIEGLALDSPDGNELLPADQAERVLIARRLISSRCLYGVDINPMAVELAKLSLWLVTLMKSRPFGFLDHALKCGDSLLGVSSVQQIENFSLRFAERQTTFATADLSHYVEEASAKRRALEALPSNDHTQIETKNRLHAEAEAAIAKVKAVADCLIAFELRGLDGNAYENQRTEEAEKLQLLMKRDTDASLDSQAPTINRLSAHAREQLSGHRPFHWSVEFPEVFVRDGFDAFVGNPPFMGGKKITTLLGTPYRNYLVAHLADATKGHADLCAYVILRADRLLNDNGKLGLVVTSAIAETDSREVGLDQLTGKNRTIFRAVTDKKWPGTANVIYSAIWLTRSAWSGAHFLNNLQVSGITPFLSEPLSVVGNPYRLFGIGKLSFLGSYIGGKGFIVPVQQAQSLIASNSSYSDVLFPYLRGKDINSSPEHSSTFWIINFFDFPLNRESAPAGYTGPVASDYPDCLQIVEALVKPERTRLDAAGDFALRKPLPQKWWIYGDKRPALYERLKKLKWSLAIAKAATKFVAFGVIEGPVVFSHSVGVIAIDSHWMLALLSSNFHETWAREYCSYNLLLLRYSTSDVFDNYPLPDDAETLDRVGENYFVTRRTVMLTRNVGLTNLYNLVHDRDEQSSDIAGMRALHVEMDQAVATAYGWSDLDLGHDFHPTKQGERFTISEPARREVLDRLLALNHERYAEEVAAGLHDKKAKKKSASRKRAKKKPNGIDTQSDLFE